MKKLLIIIWTVVAVYTMYSFFDYLVESNRSKKLSQNIRDVFQSKFLDIDGNNYLYLNYPSIIEKNKSILDKFMPVLSINEEVVGWIVVPNTKIDYPVLQTNNNEFYLNHNINKEPSKPGSIFMDFRNDIHKQNLHIIIYGHYMKNGTKFGGLEKFKQHEFLVENPIIYFDNLFEENKWQIFSVYITSVDFYYIQTCFSSLEEFSVFLKTIKDKSMFDIDVDVTPTSNILTLSTCTYEFDNARLVIHAKRVTTNND